MADELLEFLCRRYKYDPETGIFTFAEDAPGGLIGQRADSKWTQGYRAVRGLPSIKALVYAHRAAWAMYYGKFPDGPLDHINRIRDDNRLVNLRLTNKSLNNFNSKQRSDNSSGFRGVSWCKQRNKWISVISVDKQRFHLGYFCSKAEAAVAYAQAAQRYYGAGADVMAIALSETPIRDQRS